MGVVKDFFGIGYKPCTEEALSALKEAVERAPGENVPVPWSPGRYWNNTGRLCAIDAITSGNFGLAKKEGERKFKFYYR